MDWSNEKWMRSASDASKIYFACTSAFDCGRKLNSRWKKMLIWDGTSQRNCEAREVSFDRTVPNKRVVVLSPSYYIIESDVYATTSAMVEERYYCSSIENTRPYWLTPLWWSCSGRLTTPTSEGKAIRQWLFMPGVPAQSEWIRSRFTKAPTSQELIHWIAFFIW